MDGDELAAFLNARAGKLTASRMAAAMSFLKNGKPSAERTKLMHELLAERLTGDSVRHYVTPAMEHGIQTEDEARLVYECETGRLVERGVTIDHPEIDYFAATPDGFVGDGLLEIKCPTTTTFIGWRLAGVVPEEHRPQMLAQLACTGRKWVDFFAYDPRIRKHPRFMLVRYEPKPEEIAAVEDAARQFLAELDEMFEQLTSKEPA